MHIFKCGLFISFQILTCSQLHTCMHTYIYTYLNAGCGFGSCFWISNILFPQLSSGNLIAMMCRSNKLTEACSTVLITVTVQLLAWTQSSFAHTGYLGQGALAILPLPRPQHWLSLGHHLQTWTIHKPQRNVAADIHTASMPSLATLIPRLLRHRETSRLLSQAPLNLSSALPVLCALVTLESSIYLLLDHLPKLPI